MNILAIETSCDETSVSVVQNGTKVLSLVTGSSVNIHAGTGGIIPENAARKQIEYMIPTLENALSSAFPTINIEARNKVFNNIDAIAVTVGPGLIGSLLVGVETAKTLAAVYQKPLIPVNHVKAHIYGTFLGDSHPSFPLLALVVSGGHTDFVLMKNHGKYKRVGGTRDDAAGEAFDKCGKLIGLDYPGGPAIAKEAHKYISKNANKKLTLLPRPMRTSGNLDMSFSGLKTAVLRLVQENENSKVFSKEELAAEVQEAIVDILVEKTLLALRNLRIPNLVVCGGVSANLRLSSKLRSAVSKEFSHTSIHIPLNEFTGDNAAMVGSCAFFNNTPKNIETVSPNPELHF